MSARWLASRAISILTAHAITTAVIAALGGVVLAPASCDLHHEDRPRPTIEDR
jgi:hypothetical protein